MLEKLLTHEAAGGWLVVGLCALLAAATFAVMFFGRFRGPPGAGDSEGRRV